MSTRRAKFHKYLVKHQKYQKYFNRKGYTPRPMIDEVGSEEGEMLVDELFCGWLVDMYHYRHKLINESQSFN